MHAKLTYLYISLAACLVSSCTSDAPENKDVGRGAELSFAVSDVTRASESVSFNQFSVYGDRKLKGDNTVNPMVIFNQTLVEYKEGAWSYNGIQYWFPKHEHSFVAVTPVSGVGIGNNPLYVSSQLSFTYTIPTSAENKVNKGEITDILAATHRRLYSETDEPSVTTLNFGHIMSQIKLTPALDETAMKDGDYLEFHKLELSGFKTKATFNIQPASLQSNVQTDDRIVEVTGLEKDGDLTINYATPVKISDNKGNVNLLDGENAVIMIPQILAADSDAKFILTYSVNGNASTTQITLPLKNQKWEPGKSYNYKFTVSMKGLVTENTEITTWEVANVGNIDVN